MTGRETGPSQSQSCSSTEADRGQTAGSSVCSPQGRTRPLNQTPETLGCTRPRSALPFGGTIQSNMAVILHYPLPCCASEIYTWTADTADDGGLKSHVALQEGRGGEGTQRSPLGRGVIGEGFSD